MVNETFLYHFYLKDLIKQCLTQISLLLKDSDLDLHCIKYNTLYTLSVNQKALNR